MEKKRTREAGKSPPVEALEALRVCEGRFTSLLELSSEWYWELDAGCRYTLLAGAGLEKAGIDVQRNLGESPWERDAVPLEGTWDQHRAALEARQPFFDFVYRLTDAHGEVHFISSSGQPAFGTDQQFRGYRGIAREITESVRADQLLRLEHRVARSLSEADSASAALKEVIRAICETQDWECGRYFAWDDQAGGLTLDEFWHVPKAAIETFIAKSRELLYRPGDGLIGGTYQSGVPLWVPDLAREVGARAGVARDAGMHGAFLFPTLSVGKPIGVLVFHSREVRKPDERLLQAVRVIGGQLGQFVRRKSAEERIQYLATHDALTSLPNRLMFTELLDREIQAAQRYHRSFAVMFIDLDGFKAVNDTIGHEAGDRVLQEIGRAFQRCLRSSDVVSRMGGDEFVALIRETADRKEVAVVAHKILDAAAQPVSVSEQECRITASIGISMYPEEAQDLRTLLKNADSAMYRAKEQGKNTVRFFSEAAGS